MGNAGLFREFKNYKMAALSCYTFPFSFISACAPVSLWRLAIALEQMLPAGEETQGGVDFVQWPTVFFILFCEFHEVCWIRFSTWESFVNFHIWGSPISTSLACLLTVGVRISWKTWCWNETDGGLDVISCLPPCVLYCIEGEFEQIITTFRGY